MLHCLVISLFVLFSLLGCGGKVLKQHTFTALSCPRFPQSGGPLRVLVSTQNCSSCSVDCALSNVFMTDESPEWIRCNQSIQHNELMSQCFPGYSQIGTIVVDSVDSLQRKHRRIQEEFVSERIWPYTPCVYAKVSGQKTGTAGILYLSTGLGGLSDSYSPPAILCENWERLKELLDSAGSDSRWKSIGIATGNHELVGSYSVTGFDASSIPSWAESRLTVYR